MREAVLCCNAMPRKALENACILQPESILVEEFVMEISEISRVAAASAAAVNSWRIGRIQAPPGSSRRHELRQESSRRSRRDEVLERTLRFWPRTA